MKSKNIIYICCIASPWKNVIKKLAEEGIKPRHIVHWRDESSSFLKLSDNGYTRQTVEDAWAGIGFPENSNIVSLDQDELKYIAWFEQQALLMQGRLDPSGVAASTLSKLYFFRDLVGRWLSIIDQNDIDLVVSPSVPHRVFDYALYVACKLRNVKFISFQLTPFGSNSIVIDDIESMPIVNNETITNELDKQIEQRIEKVLASYDKAIPEYMTAHAKNNKSMLPGMKKLLSSLTRNLNRESLYKFKKPNTYWYKPGFLPTEQNLGWLAYFKQKITNKMKVRELEKTYSRLVTEKIDLNQPFVLIALHYQPEETSCPTGGSYADQLLIIQMVDELLPNEIKIVVKEHKSQFYADQEGACGRDLMFYRRLASLSERVEFDSVDSDPFNLIDNALATITISGTIGWESAIRGTPTLNFGRAWYEGMPRTHRIKNKHDFVEAVKVAQTEKGVNLHSEIKAFHSALQKSFIKSTHYKSYVGKGDVSIEESIDSLVNVVKNAIEMEKK